MIQSIRAKIIVTFVGLVLLNMIASFWAIYNFYQLGTTIATVVRENYQSVIAAENMVKALERQESSILLATEGEDLPVGGTFQENAELFVSWFDQAFRRPLGPEDVALRDSIQASYRRYGAEVERVNIMIRQAAVREAKQYYFDHVRGLGNQLRGLCYRLFDANEQAIARAQVTTHSLANQTAFGVLMASIVALALSVIATAWLTKSVIEPAERLTETVKQMGRGKLDLKLDVLSNDEIGTLSREFNKMTERLRQYEQLNIERMVAEQRKSEAIVATITDGIIVADAGMRLLLVNRVVADLFGIEPARAEGRPVGEAIPDARIAGLISDHLAVPSRPEARPMNVLKFQRGDRTMFVRPNVSSIVDPSGGISGVLVVLQDVTQFKELDRMKSEFIATLSHEFRTPVTSISMTVDILNRGILGPLNERQKELADSAKQDCVRLTKLARDLLQLSKLESGKLQLSDEVLEVGEVLEASLRPLQVQFGEKGVRLVTEVTPGVPHLVADRHALTSVVSNLATNALKNTESGGVVTVGARADGDAVLIDVSDTGQGIPPEHLRDIFDKFVQVKAASETTPGSVGLGLSIAKEIVEIYGGQIWAESEPGKGSRFFVRLPAGKGKEISDI